MTDYYALLRGRWALSKDDTPRVHSWMNDVSPGHEDLEGHGNDVDAWRHGGVAALLAYRNGYSNVIRWGNALEDYHPDNEQEALQDYWNNDIGARIGAVARTTGMTVDELGDAVKAAFRQGVFQTNAYAPFRRVRSFKIGQMTVSLDTGLVTLPDGSQFDLKNSERLGHVPTDRSIFGPSFVDRFGNWCPSSDDLRLVRRFVKGGSGSSGLEFKRPATDAASVG